MRTLQRILLYAMLLLGSVSFLMPLALMISTGLKPIEQTMSAPPTWIPYRLYVQKDGVLTEIKQADVNNYPAASIIKKPAPRWSNYVEAIKAMKVFPRYLGNTLILCVLTVVGTVLSSSLAAYGFSRIEWRGRNSLFVLDRSPDEIVEINPSTGATLNRFAAPFDIFFGGLAVDPVTNNLWVGSSVGNLVA